MGTRVINARARGRRDEARLPLGPQAEPLPRAGPTGSTSGGAAALTAGRYGSPWASEEPFAFAGLWDTWRGPGGEAIVSSTIITTEANDPLRPIHDRMAVILPRDLEPLWLDG